MQAVLEAAKHSSIIEVASKSASLTTSPYDYSGSRALGFPGTTVAKQKFSVNATQLAGWGSTFSVNIPPYGLVERLTAKLDFTAAGAYIPSAAVGLFAFSKIELVNQSGVVLSELYPEALHVKIEAMPIDARTKYYALVGGAATPGPQVDGSTTTVYCPLLFDFMEKPCTFLDALSLEQLSIQFHMRAYADVLKAATASAITGFHLMCQYQMPHVPVHRSLIEQRHPGGAEWNFLHRSWFKESNTISAVTPVAIPLFCQKPVIRTILISRLTADIATEKDLGKHSPVLTVSLSDSGNTLWDSTVLELVALESSMLPSTSTIYMFEWGSYDPSNPERTTAISFKSMSNPTLNITNAPLARTYSVFHEVLQASSVGATPNLKNRPWVPIGDT